MSMVDIGASSGDEVRELVSLGARAAGAEPRFERRAREREQRRAGLVA